MLTVEGGGGGLQISSCTTAAARSNNCGIFHTGQTTDCVVLATNVQKVQQRFRAHRGSDRHRYWPDPSTWCHEAKKFILGGIVVVVVAVPRFDGVQSVGTVFVGIGRAGALADVRLKTLLRETKINVNACSSG